MLSAACRWILGLKERVNAVCCMPWVPGLKERVNVICCMQLDPRSEGESECYLLHADGS
jgi:hypothetical protein